MSGHIFIRALLLRRIAATVGLMAVAGCGQTPAPTPADETQARQTLDQALGSWQKGEAATALKAASPSILIADPDWERGQVLKKYEVRSAGKPSGAEREFDVTLWLDDSKGKELRRAVVYRVGTNPILTVFRSLF